MATPIISLEDSNASIVVRRDVPEPITYQGRNLIELDFRDEDISDEEFFKPAAFVIPDTSHTGIGGSSGITSGSARVNVDLTDIAANIDNALRAGVVNQKILWYHIVARFANSDQNYR